MNTLKFQILGIPVPKQSMKVTKGGIKYQPKKITNAARNIRAQIANQLPRGFEPFDKHLRIYYRFVFPYTSDISKRKRNSGIKLWKDKKPDIDNLQKLINDAMEGVVFVRDAQICSIRAEKFMDSVPRVDVEVSLLNGGLKKNRENHLYQ